LERNGVTVTAAARLHLGFLDLNGELGRRFGSIGLAINGFKTRLSALAARQMRISGPEQERIRAHVDAMRPVLGDERAYGIRVDEVVPAHAGLGSGTQLALALATALRRLHGLPLDLRADAVRLGRGGRSGAGIGLFQHGGLVVDGGRATAAAAAPVISSMPFPDQWRIFVVLDARQRGVHGPDEAVTFARLPPSSATDAAQLCRLLVMKLLPAVAEADLAAFGSALTAMQERLGAYFAPAQGGDRFVSQDVADALRQLARAGAVGIGQSSWGPTGYAFAPSADAASHILQTVRRHGGNDGVDIRICKALNCGAEIASYVPAKAPDC
jgi:beta-RFAP synthase